MKQLRGARLYFYSLSCAGYALALATLAAGGVAFYYPTTELLKAGVARAIPASLSGTTPSLVLAGALGLLALLAVLPAAGFQSDRSRAGLGRRRVFILMALLPLALSALLFFLPPVSAESGFNLFLLCAYAVIFLAAFGLARPAYLALGYEEPASEQDRMKLAVVQAAFTGGGLLAAAIILPGFFEAFPTLGPAGSFQTSALLLVLGAALAISAAFFAVHERRSSHSTPPARPKGPFVPAMLKFYAALAARRPLSLLLPAEGALFFALSVLVIFFFTAGADLLVVDRDFIRVTLVASLGAGLAALPFIRLLAKKWGKKKLLSIGLLGFSGGLVILAFTGAWPNPAGLSWNCATAAAQTADGSIHIGTWRGAARFRYNAWSTVTRHDGLIDDRLTALVADGGNLWFATQRGASLYDGRQWTHFSDASGLIDNRVLSVIPRDRAVWFQTPRGISLLENVRWQQYFPEIPGKKEPVADLTCFALGQRGELWVGSERGAYRLTETGWTEYTTADGLPDDTVTSLAVAPTGDILFGTYRGAARLADKTWSYLTTRDGLPSDLVRRIKIAPDGRIFIATAAGVYIVDGTSHRTLTRADGLAHDAVNDILFAADGSIWFVTGNGVSVMDQGRFRQHQHPLPWIWGLVALILLGLPVALLLSVPRVFEAEAAEAVRSRTGERLEGQCFALFSWVRSAAFLVASVFVLCLFSVGGQSLADPRPARWALLAAALAGLASVFFYYRTPGAEKKTK